MIKVESDMLVLDSSFTKEDVEAINYFVALAEKRTEERIIKLLDEIVYSYDGFLEISSNITTRDDLIALIKGENK